MLGIIGFDFRFVVRRGPGADVSELLASLEEMPSDQTAVASRWVTRRPKGRRPASSRKKADDLCSANSGPPGNASMMTPFEVQLGEGVLLY